MDNIKLMSLSPNISIDQQMLEMFLLVRTTQLPLKEVLHVSLVWNMLLNPQPSLVISPLRIM
jgi:hypothetical protein